MEETCAKIKKWLGRSEWVRRQYLYLKTQKIKLHMSNNKFAIDNFPRRNANRLESVSGWYMPASNDNCQIQVWLEEMPLVGLLRIYRHDVAAAFPDIPLAAKSGFIGDVIIPGNIKAGDKFSLSIRAVYPDRIEILDERDLELNNSAYDIKARGIDFSDILCDPATGESIKKYAGCLKSELTHRQIPTVAGVPHFYPEGRPSSIRLTEKGSTHPYNSVAQEIIDQSNLVLDFGAGIQTPDRLRDHVVNLDAVHFPFIDVVNTFSTLPFKNGTFDAVISQAVFEHLPNPFQAAQEMCRVLRPGGLALIDTAFMQPFHGDPSHYFNMTRTGLLEIMGGFEILELGVRPYQAPSLGLIMQIESILPFLSTGAWRTRLQQALEVIKQEGGELDSSLGEVGREVIAAGVYVLAKKPY